MKTNRVAGERVEFLTDGSFGSWENNECMKGHDFTDCYGIRQSDGNFFIYSKKTNEQLSLSENIDTTWCFFDEEVKVINKPSILSRLYTAIKGALFGSYHRDRYQDGEQ